MVGCFCCAFEHWLFTRLCRCAPTPKASVSSSVAGNKPASDKIRTLDFQLAGKNLVIMRTGPHGHIGQISQAPGSCPQSCTVSVFIRAFVSVLIHPLLRCWTVRVLRRENSKTEPSVFAGKLMRQLWPWGFLLQSELAVLMYQDKPQSLAGWLLINLSFFLNMSFMSLIQHMLACYCIIVSHLRMSTVNLTEKWFAFQ